jgi:hypothetical protein
MSPNGPQPAGLRATRRPRFALAALQLWREDGAGHAKGDAMRLTVAAAAIVFAMASTLAQGDPISAWGGGVTGPPHAMPAIPPCTPNLSDLAKNGSQISNLSTDLTAAVIALTSAEQAYNNWEATAVSARNAAQAQLNAAAQQQTGSPQWDADMQSAVQDEQQSSGAFSQANGVAAGVASDRALVLADQKKLDALLGCPSIL